MDITAQQIVSSALRLVGRMGAPGRDASPEQLTEVLQFLNQRLSSWNIMRNSVYVVIDSIYTLTPNVQFYSIGPTAVAGTFNGQTVMPLAAGRPNSIERANLIFQTAPQTVRLPIKIINVDQWASIRVENIFALPLKIYYDHSYSMTAPTGNGLIYLWPGPQAAYQLELFTTQAIVVGSLLQSGDTIFCPDGYAETLVFDLALAIMPLYSDTCDAAREARIVRNAARTRKWLEVSNAPWPISQIDGAIVDQSSNDFNWLVQIG